MLVHAYIFVGVAAVFFSAASMHMSTSTDVSISEAAFGQQNDEAPKWSLVMAPSSAVAWAIFSVASLNVEIPGGCCGTVIVSENLSVMIFAALFSVLFSLIFIKEVIELYGEIG